MVQAQSQYRPTLGSTLTQHISARNKGEKMDDRQIMFDIELDDGEEITEDTYEELSNGKGDRDE